MKVSTSRFGELEINASEIIEFQDGILGFESHKKFFVVDPGDSSLILWLQSSTDEKIAFPIIEPQIFKSDYQAKLLPVDLKSVSLESEAEATIYTILTIPADIKAMSANLKAPVVINNNKKIAKQIVLQDNKLSVNYEMYNELRATIISNPVSDDTNRTAINEPSNKTDAPKAEDTANANLEKRPREKTL